MPSFWNGRRVLVTGANGFLASWMVRELVHAGAQVVALVFARNPLSIFEQERFDARTETIYGDVLNLPLLTQMLQKFRIEMVFHLGAQAICTAAEEDPLTTLDINVKGTAHVLEAVRRVAPRTNVIVASSDKAYGTHEVLPYEEHFPLHGEYPYEVSKSCADLITTMYWKTYHVPAAIVRCGNLFGGGDAHFSRIIPATVKLAYHNQPPVVTANDMRDYLYVADAVRGYLLLGERMAQGACHGEAFNFGTEHPRSVLEVMEAILGIMGKSHIAPQHAANPRRGIPSQYLACAKARALLGWEPQTSFADGLRATVAWYTEYFARTATMAIPEFTTYHRDLLPTSPAPAHAVAATP